MAELSKLRYEDFICLEPILSIVEASIWTGRVALEKPVSLLLIAEQESAKTEALLHFKLTNTLQYISDITSRGIGAYQRDIEQGKLRHFVILDLVRIVNHPKGVSDRCIANLASLMEEGEADTSDAGGRRSWSDMPKIGCLMSITPKFFASRAGNWRKTGFMTRFLPVRFKYTPRTVQRIHKAIANDHKMPPPIALKLPELPTAVELPEAAKIMLRDKALRLGQLNNVYGFRYQRSLRRLAKANALMRGSSLVNEADMCKVLEWADFFTEKEIEL